MTRNYKSGCHLLSFGRCCNKKEDNLAQPNDDIDTLAIDFTIFGKLKVKTVKTHLKVHLKFYGNPIKVLEQLIFWFTSKYNLYFTHIFEKKIKLFIDTLAIGFTIFGKLKVKTETVLHTSGNPSESAS